MEVSEEQKEAIKKEILHEVIEVIHEVVKEMSKVDNNKVKFTEGEITRIKGVPGDGKTYWKHKLEFERKSGGRNGYAMLEQNDENQQWVWSFNSNRSVHAKINKMYEYSKHDEWYQSNADQRKKLFEEFTTLKMSWINI